MLLNIPIDRDGLVNPADSIALMQLRARLDATFSQNIALKSKKNWEKNILTLDLKEKSTFDVISLKENISQGQMIDGWKVEAWVNQKWISLGEGTTVGYQRWLILPKTTSSKIRIHLCIQSQKIKCCVLIFLKEACQILYWIRKNSKSKII